MEKIMRTALNLITATATFGLLASTVFAIETPDAGRLLRESTPLPALAPPLKKPVIETPADKTQQPLPESIKIHVTGFSYSGNTLFTAKELNVIMAPVVGKEMTLLELGKAVERITQAYRRKGYILATATIPPQVIKSGQPVKVEIIEGKLEEITLKTTPVETRTPRRLLDQYSNRIEKGKPVNADSLTETAMLLNELPALQTRIVLEPGKEVGSTKATLEVTEGKPYSVSLFTDNYGNYSTGYYRVGAGLELYSPFHLGDRLSIRGQSSTSGDTQSVGAGWNVPVNSYGTRIAMDYSWVRYKLGRSFESLDANGDAHGFNLTIIQPLVRRSNLILNAILAGEGRLLDDRINSVASVNKRHTASVQAGVNLYAADSLLTTGYTSFNVTYTGGVLRFGNNDAKANDQDATAGLHTEGAYHKISGSLSRSQAIYNDLSLFASISGQWSDKNLDSAEQLSIGGPTAVRAYPVGEASADQGMITTAELRYLLPKLEPLPGRVQLAGLFDHGYARINTKPLPGATSNIRHLYGAGFGVNWQWDDFISLKTSVAWRQGELPTSDNTSGDKPTVYFQAVVRY
jgi:hemolysin activation/secretion protein